ncbi:conserved hypothetical protein [Neospora caninum Liverpool]|uniref:Transmembrane protein n=1 Tax=Neospora caninum (strain Liverpool) TaxID=572307 RepID=F0VHV5_NEOCL|nr:conserved hypothetical protein [Neospora caninum Liverpool]CBZ53316.1 conserved hypothetical protein [Neospora caninum Liverpool]CEL67302.1 TPA: hypothetical protein BN1204_031030 [Neospora caninum Liverpool]|eukprot:XP_003883348.1 conserved hypothetical protein [Neospora caninum Liverpool]
MVGATFALRGHAARDCVRLFVVWATISTHLLLCCSATSNFLYDVRLSVFSGLGVGSHVEGKQLGRLAIREYSRPAEPRAVNSKNQFSGGAGGAAPAFAEGPTRAVRASWISFSDSVLSSAVEAATREQESAQAEETQPSSTYPLLSLRLEPVANQEDGKNQHTKNIPPALEASAPVFSFMRESPRPGSPSAVCDTEPPFLLSLHVSPSLVPFSASIQRVPDGSSGQIPATQTLEAARSLDTGSANAVSERFVVTCPDVAQASKGQNAAQSRSRVPALQVVLPPTKAAKDALIVPAYFPGEGQHRAPSVGAPGQEGEGEKPEEQPSFWRRNWWLILGVLLMASLMGGDSGGASPQNEQGTRGAASANPSQRPREGIDRRR